MMVLRAGARHVTAVDRWLYMALACKESLVRLPELPLPALMPHDVSVGQTIMDACHMSQEADQIRQCISRSAASGVAYRSHFQCRGNQLLHPGCQRVLGGAVQSHLQAA